MTFQKRNSSQYRKILKKFFESQFQALKCNQILRQHWRSKRKLNQRRRQYSIKTRNSQNFSQEDYTLFKWVATMRKNPRKQINLRKFFTLMLLSLTKLKPLRNNSLVFWFLTSMWNRKWRRSIPSNWWISPLFRTKSLVSTLECSTALKLNDLDDYHG